MAVVYSYVITRVTMAVAHSYVISKVTTAVAYSYVISKITTAVAYSYVVSKVNPLRIRQLCKGCRVNSVLRVLPEPRLFH